MISLIARFACIAGQLLCCATALRASSALYYNDWIADSLPGEVRVSAGGIADDPDGDGIVNGCEFLWGLNPMQADPAVVWSSSLQTDPPQIEFSVPATLPDRLGIDLDLSSSPDLIQWGGATAGESGVDGKRNFTVDWDPQMPLFLAPRLIVSSLDKPYVPDFSLVGWASEAGGTTGGAGGSEVTVTTYDQLVAALTSKATLIVYVSGTIRGAGTSIRVSSNKSILGLGAEARLENLGLQIGWNSSFGQIGNVIIRNIHFGEVLAPTDKILVSYGGHHVWIDHCVFESPPTTDTDKYDGQLDITHGADYVTVSWCRFIQHSKNSLVGHSENNAAEDTGHLRVTYHHNEFRNTNSRNPSVRFGTVHVFNNYYNNVTDYGIAARLGAQVVVENNYFLNVLEPMNADTNLSDIPGHIRGEETNIYINCGPNSIISAPATWIPPYAYTLDDASLVPAAVDSYAGTGVVSW